MDPDLSLTLIRLAREFAGVPAQELVDVIGATVLALSSSDACAVYDEAARHLTEMASEQAQTSLPWEWTAEDDAAWRLTDDP